jgi:hypothetical protein
MNLFQAITYRSRTPGYALGPIETPLCQGRCCGNRTAPLLITFGVKGALFLCAECRAWHHRIIRTRLAEIRRER